MEPEGLEGSERRREPRFPVVAGGTVEVSKNNHKARATTVDISGCGVLLDFDAPLPLAVGDQVVCEFQVNHAADQPLPYWAVGNVVRVADCRAAIDLTAGGLSPMAAHDGPGLVGGGE
jgi:hypothetical protein